MISAVFSGNRIDEPVWMSQDSVWVGLVACLISGFAAGLVLNRFSSWCKDLRDLRLRACGLSLPSDRFPGRWQWPICCLAGVLGVVASIQDPASPGWALPVILMATLAFVLPGGLLLTFRMINTFRFLYLRTRPYPDFDPKLLVGMSAFQAIREAKRHGWHSELVALETTPGLVSSCSQPSAFDRLVPTLHLRLEGCRVTRVNPTQKHARCD